MPFFAARTVARLTSFVGLAALATACSVYEADPSDSHPDAGGAAGSGGGGASGGAASAGTGGAGGAGVSGAGGTGSATGHVDGGIGDDAGVDADGTSPDTAPDRVPVDAFRDSVGEISSADAGQTDTTLDDVSNDVSNDGPRDTPAMSDASETGTPPIDVSIDVQAPDADATSLPDSGGPDTIDAGPTVQILPKHGPPIEKPDAGGPFDSRCATDEVVTGFRARAGVQTDAIGSTCSKLIGGVLSSPRNLPLVGNPGGGGMVTITCPSNHVAVGIVGRYGHNSDYDEEVTTSLGVVCKDLASSATQIARITTQPDLDTGYTSFREDCTGGRYLTDISGITDSNSLSYTVQQVGGECSVR